MSRLILREPTHTEANPDYVFEDMQQLYDFELHALCLKFKSLSDHRLDDETILSSGKFQKLDEMLPPFKRDKKRVLIFSQFTMILDILERYMEIRGHHYARLDGRTNVNERLDLIDGFNDDSSIFVFLLSTKAGGLGINLTSANIVIIHDIDFNPYNDKQAEDRCHRMGQKEEVTIYRFISENSVEEGMYQIAEEKLKLGEDICDQDRKSGRKEDQKDMKTLLRQVLGM
jgi:SWI/SNF-related matrix-associated actin-dependent regulator 1 of chromatin subfamily A